MADFYSYPGAAGL